MPNSSTSVAANAAQARRLRPASPAVHGGASSLLRLARHGTLPGGAALSGWAERAAAMLDLTPMMVGGSQPFTAAAVPARRQAGSEHAQVQA